MTQINEPFALFAGGDYATNGGIYDFRQTYSTLAEAKEAAAGSYWYHVVDLRTMKVVDEDDVGRPRS